MISIIIPTFNRGYIIERALESIEKQSYRNWECIIVDDSSTDNTEKIVFSFHKRDARFKYLCNSRTKGAQGARNTGIIASKGDYIVLFDSDNVMCDSFLQETLDKIIADSADICGSFSKVIDSTTNNVIGEFHWSGYGMIHSQIMKRTCYFDNSSTLIRKQKLIDIDLLDENCPSFQEWDTHIRLSRNAKYTTVEKFLVEYYRGHDDAISFSLDKEIKGYVFILKKYRREWVFKHFLFFIKIVLLVLKKEIPNE